MEKTRYKTPADVRERIRVRYETEKAARGAEFLAERAKWKREWRAKGGSVKDRSRHKGKKKPLKGWLLRHAKRRARLKGLGHSIARHEVYWPTHCPVLGIELDYVTPRGKRKANAANLPSLDRWDGSLGYVPGNVFVISLRANSIKSNATADELEAVARYARTRPVLPNTDLFR